MNNQDLFVNFQKFNWQELIQFLNKSAVQNHIKILTSAIIEIFHPDQELQKKFSLSSCWDEKLSNIALSKIQAEISARVSLYDFYTAYLQATLIYEENPLVIDKVQSVECAEFNPIVSPRLCCDSRSPFVIIRAGG